MDISHIPGIKWGIEKETTRQEYIAEMSSLHQGFLTGLVVNPSIFLGASPDALVEYSC